MHAAQEPVSPSKTEYEEINYPMELESKRI